MIFLYWQFLGKTILKHILLIIQALLISGLKISSEVF